jgi:RES domain-containing protein
MMEADASPDSLTITSIVRRETVRLIPTGRLKPPALGDLVDTPEERDRLAHLEMLTSARHLAEARGALLDVAPNELLGESYGWGWTFINAAFCYTRHGGNRFNGPERGAWYAGFDINTAQAEVAWHLTRELEAANYFVNSTDYSALLADFIGDFHDARTLSADNIILDQDISRAYPAGQNLAKRLRTQKSNGVIYPSVRQGGGTCLAAFKPYSVQNLKQGAVWRFEWADARAPKITIMSMT